MVLKDKSNENRGLADFLPEANGNLENLITKQEREASQDTRKINK
ncbi:hypothetical protein ACFSTE_10970 [Aquimarina hainanensis]|uniref:Uncharacterized protein n=1 Tax=Aquimarina hainanensis TaxID=1578017 RepID=A0ABW5N954_9FLAO|nr:hypothetical protein [Aquimarina sp. TRL1]